MSSEKHVEKTDAFDACHWWNLEAKETRPILKTQTAVHKRFIFWSIVLLKRGGGRGNPTEKREQLKKRKKINIE